MLIYSIGLNLLLLAFNLIPIPPLDGSHVIKHLLPPSLAAQYERFGRFGGHRVLAQVTDARAAHNQTPGGGGQVCVCV